jgi:hypothetical protein
MTAQKAEITVGDVVREVVLAVIPSVLMGFLAQHPGVLIEADAGALVIVNEPVFTTDPLDKPDGRTVRDAEVPRSVHRLGAVDRHVADAAFPLSPRHVRAKNRPDECTFPTSKNIPD